MRQGPGPHCESTAGEEAKVGDVDAEVNERQTMKAFMGEYGSDLPKSGWRSELMVGDGEKILWMVKFFSILITGGGVEWGEGDKEQ